MISPVNPKHNKTTKLIAVATIVLVGVANIVALAHRDGCSNPSFASYGNVNDCPKR